MRNVPPPNHLLTTRRPYVTDAISRCEIAVVTVLGVFSPICVTPLTIPMQKTASSHYQIGRIYTTTVDSFGPHFINVTFSHHSMSATIARAEL